ncbi:MAG: beta-ketoacyl-[acyl-carrier-protein] synthase family protein [Planctomycetaceae bacterium]|nr:beta-ketoacyl-[acyl-carrier-protein] synthase family protein [Planctomycetaceae bacterium]
MAGCDGSRIVVTGVGVVSPVGIGCGSFWESLRNSKSGIDYLSSIHGDDLPCPFGAEVRDFNPITLLRERKFIKIMSRDMQLGVASANLAMQDSGLNPGDVDPYRLGVVFGAGRMTTHPGELAAAVDASFDSKHEFSITRWGENGIGRIAPLWLLRQLPNMPACYISIDHNACGPNNTITCRDASALLALAEAVRVVESGRADAMIVGACSSNIHPVDIAKFHRFEGLSRRHDSPSRACRPFDFERDGAVVGEGAATFIVERYDHAQRRGADIYAEILGIGAGCDGRGYANEAGGLGLVRAIDASLKKAGVSPRDLGHINAHGKSTQPDDIVESRAFHRSLGDCVLKVPVTAMKSFIGHFDAGAGAVELAGTLLSLKHGEVPPTLNYEIPDPRCRLNVVHDGPQRLATRTALTVNRTAMGQSAAAVLRAL